MNNDGTPQLDSDGSFILIYDNNDIREFAKIFTLIGSGSPNAQWGVFDL